MPSNTKPKPPPKKWGFCPMRQFGLGAYGPVVFCPFFFGGAFDLEPFFSSTAPFPIQRGETIQNFEPNQHITQEL